MLIPYVSFAVAGYPVNPTPCPHGMRHRWVVVKVGSPYCRMCRENGYVSVGERMVCCKRELSEIQRFVRDARLVGVGR